MRFLLTLLLMLVIFYVGFCTFGLVVALFL